LDKGKFTYTRFEALNSVNSICKKNESPKILEEGCGASFNMYLLSMLNPKLRLYGFEYILDCLYQ